VPKKITKKNTEIKETWGGENEERKEDEIGSIVS